MTVRVKICFARSGVGGDNNVQLIFSIQQVVRADGHSDGFGVDIRICSVASGFG